MYLQNHCHKNLLRHEFAIILVQGTTESTELQKAPQKTNKQKQQYQR